MVWSGAVVGPHPELDRARVLGLPVLGRAVALNAIAARADAGAVTVAVAGSHSTTTAAAALAHVLDDGHTGWILNTPTRGGVAGHAAGQRIVIDLCPDNATHEAAPPAAWQRHPAPHTSRAEPHYAAALITATGANAPHYEDDVAGLDAAERIARRAEVVVLPTWDRSTALLRDRRIGRPGPRVVTVGRDSSSTVQVTHLTDTAAGSRIVLRHEGTGHSFDVPVAGRHHALAVCAAIATALAIGEDPQTVVQRAMVFPGARRSLATVGTQGGATMVDSRARHPREIAQDVLEAARLLTEGSLLVVLEPDGLARAGAHAAELGEALSDTDRAVLLPVATPLTRHTLPDPLDAIEQAALEWLGTGKVHRVHPGSSEVDVVRRIGALAGPGDLVLIVGTGQAEHLGPRLLAHLALPASPTPQP